MTETTLAGRAETPVPEQQTHADFSALKHDTVQTWIGIDFGYSDADIHEALGLPMAFIARVRRDYRGSFGYGEGV